MSQLSWSLSLGLKELFLVEAASLIDHRVMHKKKTKLQFLIISLLLNLPNRERTLMHHHINIWSIMTRMFLQLLSSSLINLQDNIIKEKDHRLEPTKKEKQLSMETRTWTTCCLIMVASIPTEKAVSILTREINRLLKKKPTRLSIVVIIRTMGLSAHTLLVVYQSADIRKVCCKNRPSCTRIRGQVTQGCIALAADHSGQLIILSRPMDKLGSTTSE